MPMLPDFAGDDKNYFEVKFMLYKHLILIKII